jgi:hypothetical protein
LSWASGNPLVQFTAADTISLTLTPSVTSITLSGQGLGKDGAQGSPSWSFTNAATYGFYYASSSVRLAIAGALHLNIYAGAFDLVTAGAQYLAPNCTASLPSFLFRNDQNTGLYYIGANNFGISIGGTKRVDLSTTLIDFVTPARSRVPISSETGTPTTASANKKVALASAPTINTGFTADDFILFDPGTSSRVFTRGSGMTMYVNGSDVASATLAANQMGTVHFRSATVAVLSGAFT